MEISSEIFATQIHFTTLPLTVHSRCCSGVQYCLAERRHLFLEPLPLLSLLKLNIHIQWNAALKQPNITWYYRYHCSTKAEYKSECEPTKDTPYIALTGELWGVFCEWHHTEFKSHDDNTFRLYRYKSGKSLQMTFSNAFSWKKLNKFGSKFHWCLFASKDIK